MEEKNKNEIGAGSQIAAADPIVELYSGVDAITRARAGNLAARGLSLTNIADVLLLTIDQVDACRHSEEYKKKYSEVADEEITRQLERDEGWDLVEEKSIAAVLETLQYNRDPKYALMAAKIANDAKRRAKQNTQHVIDGKQDARSNVIVLKLNQTFINTTQKNDGEVSAVLDITPKLKGAQPQRRIDLPPPQAVENLLTPVGIEIKPTALTEMERMFQDAGIVVDEFKDTDG